MIKKLRGYLIARYDNMCNSYTCKRLEEEAKSLNIEMNTIGVCDTIICENKILHKANQLDKVDFLINRHKHGHIKDRLNSLAKKSYNNLSSFNTYLDKFSQLENISSSHFLKPKYFLASADKSFEEVSKILSDPFVIKGLDGSEGDQVYLIKSEEDLKKIRTFYGIDKEFLFEEFIESSFGRDIRMYAIKGKIKAAMLRKSNMDFRANFALGAEVSPYDISPKMEKISEDIYKITGLDFVGIDLLFGRDNFYFCEVNVMAGIKGIEKATGTNIAREILLSIKEDFNE